MRLKSWVLISLIARFVGNAKYSVDLSKLSSVYSLVGSTENKNALNEGPRYSTTVSWSVVGFAREGLTKRVAAKLQAAANDSHMPGIARFPEA